MAAAQVEGRFNEAVSYALSRIGLPNLELKREQLAAIRFLYDRKDVFLWTDGFREIGVLRSIAVPVRLRWQ